MAKADKNLTLDEAAELTGISRMTIYRRVKDGALNNVATPIPGLKRQPVKVLRSEVLKEFPPRKAD